MKTGFVWNDKHTLHVVPTGFPERPSRIQAILDSLQGGDILSRLVTLKNGHEGLSEIEMVHSRDYIERVETACKNGDEFIDSPDVPLSKGSFDAAVTGVHYVLTAVDAVAKGNVQNAFCAIRPPGHHALKNTAMGFCFFNNIAIAARHLQKAHGFEKILIVDWDVHHGNGTQEIFYDDPTVFFFSIHQFPFYPGTGSSTETGTGKGQGYTLNIPMQAGAGDREYLDVFEKWLLPAAEKFRPDFILISAGFDAHEDDPLGGMKITAEGFGHLTGIVKKIAEQYCSGKLVSLLEGGYDLQGLADSVSAHLKILMK